MIRIIIDTDVEEEVIKRRKHHMKLCKEKISRRPSFCNILAMTLKNWIMIRRNLLMLYFMFLAPAFLCILDCIAVGQEPRDISLAFMNYESNCSAFDEDVCQPNKLGCHFLQSVKRTANFTINQMDDMDAAVKLAKNGDVKGLITIPQNFSTSFLKRVLDRSMFSKFTFFFGIDDAESIRKDEKLNVSIDMSDPIWAGFLKNYIVQSLIRFQENLAVLCKRSYNIELDFSIMDQINSTIGENVINYTEFITCAAIMLPIYFLAVAKTADAFIEEKSQGLLERSLVAGVLPVEIIVSFIVSHFFSVLIQVS